MTKTQHTSKKNNYAVIYKIGNQHSNNEHKKLNGNIKHESYKPSDLVISGPSLAFHFLTN